MRGKQEDREAAIRYLRNIPAHAGKTPRFSRSPPRWWEHPRACGENLAMVRTTSGPVGTSPRMRGKPEQHAPAPGAVRNIPAHAGKTTPASTGSTTGREHPRACGENTTNSVSLLIGTGTSPRMRGKPIIYFGGGEPGWNIPAHAGKTPTVARGSNLLWEHPRACGENGDSAAYFGR